MPKLIITPKAKPKIILTPSKVLNPRNINPAQMAKGKSKKAA